ncbi:hypothetical protein [Pseudoroseomonas cervicalis]|uniref:hypothetical protein n=1 Tax=Teichococcus cervicalis TaxID=204525 RepID=UPI002788B9B8|nr:hypothetical protein [Pseudoroseomonas cervicalis]MDQ1081413.1 hypothetical protein [Pseudoroseomonas cervicalis]
MTPPLTRPQLAMLSEFRHGKTVLHDAAPTHALAGTLTKLHLLRIERWDGRSPHYRTTEAGMEALRDAG